MSEFDEMLASYPITAPQDRLNAVHEVMQQVTLAALNKAGFFRHAAFYGGTCLRIFHGLPRFSEDLDFSLLTPAEDFDFPACRDAIVQEFESFNHRVEVVAKEKTHKSAIFSVFLKSDTQQYDIRLSREQKIKVKLEIDTSPPCRFETEQKLLLQPYAFYTRCYTLPCLFAGKMHALLFRRWANRIKGRDWYDFGWYVRKRIPLDFPHLQERIACSEGSPLPSVEDFRGRLRERVTSINWDNAKEDIIPFIKDRSELEVWSENYFLQLADMLLIHESR